MERGVFDRTDLKPDIDTPPRANSRFAPPLVINSASQRRSLFSRSGSGSKEGAAISSDANMSSPNSSNTRIPRPAQQRASQTRRPLSMSEAWKLAEEEEEKAAQGSPSPAPRPWLGRRDSKPKQSPNTGNETPSDLQQRRKRLTGLSKPALDESVSSVGSSAAHSLRSEVSERGSFDEKLRQHAAEQGEFLGDSPKRNSGLFSKSKFGTKVAEVGKDLIRKTSRSSLDGGSPTQSSKAKPNASWLSRRFSSRKSEPSNGMAEHEVAGQDPFRRPTAPSPGNQSPVNKSFAWEADADFTAGDLQASESPPVVIGRTNSKIDEIRELEARAHEIFPEPESPKLRPRNTRIDEIRAAEIEAAQRFPDEPTESREEVQDTRPSAKTDDLRAREIESLSRRALATTRLDEIRERDAEYRSRSSSPELVRQASRELLRSLSPINGGVRKQEKQGVVATSSEEEEGRRTGVDEVPSVPIVAASTKDDDIQPKPVTEGRSREGTEGMEGTRPGRGSSHTRDASRDVLRRLALATSTTPSPEQRVGKEEIIIPILGKDGKEAPRQRRSDGLKSDVRLIVGFAGLRRDSSVESGSDKRSNIAQSDSDPIERIEGEMQLFAPLENHSERGSLRAPSPELDEDAPDETPRPPKHDALAQPTPRVTGAYVETPATIKAEKLEIGPALVPARVEAKPDGASTNAAASGAGATPFRGRNRNGSAPRPRPASTVSAKDDVPIPRSASLATHRRSRSLPRQRSRLANSSKPPTVKDDLLEIQRANHVEDSTLDDFADVLDAHERDYPESKSRRTKFEDSDDDILDTFDRMNKSLQTGLLGIQSAKRGIERLENEVSHVDSKRLSHNHDVNVTLVCPACHEGTGTGTRTGAGTLTHLHLPMPRLWSRQKGFRFTWLGLLLFLLSLWYIAESSMCFFFCKPQYCYPGKPCGWSMNDPHWGYSIPVKLDQWTTGGKGRALADKVRPEVADWLADIWDVATSTDITAVDTSRYSWKQKRQYRRRLAKKGLVPSSADSPEERAKFAAWRDARLARERAESAMEMGYDVSEEEESMSGDERI